MKIMISGNEITLRKATEADVDKIKELVDKHKTELGFVMRPALISSIKSSELNVAVESEDSVIGLIHYRHRKDGQTTIYNIVVRSDYRRQSIGAHLIEQLQHEARELGQSVILLKCPTNLQANDFYKALNFALNMTENGKKRPLNIWQLSISEH